jgi:hypothetical protein
LLSSRRVPVPCGDGAPKAIWPILATLGFAVLRGLFLLGSRHKHKNKAMIAVRCLRRRCRLVFESSKRFSNPFRFFCLLYLAITKIMTR